MKYYLSVTKNNIPEQDKQAWLYLANIFTNRKNSKAQDLINFAEKVCAKFPALSNKIAWDNYLVPDINEEFVSFEIDYSNIEEITSCIKEMAQEYNLVVFDSKEDKIYRLK